MKRLLSILLAALILCTGLAMTFGATASAAPAKQADAASYDSLFQTIKNYVSGVDLENLSDFQEKLIVGVLEALQKADTNDFIGKALKEIDKQYNLPVTFKKLLHDHGIYSFPFYERSVFWNFIFKYLFLGFIWMPLVK